MEKQLWALSLGYMSVVGGGEGPISFMHLLPGALSDWTLSINCEVAKNPFEKLQAAILFAPGSSPQ